MTMISHEEERGWAKNVINDYQQLYPRYLNCAQTLQQLLEKAVKPIAPQAIIQTRPKSIPSFAEKAIRKKRDNRYSDPLNRMTDLCGGRVITQTLTEVQAVSEFIKNNFIIDEENSVDVSQRLKPSEFGYRSIHYIIQLKPGVFPNENIPVYIPEDLYPDDKALMKAEIQVRTVLEHGWAGFVHDRVYKSAFVIPPKWERELAVLAGMIEQIDQSFSRIQKGLRTYAASYGAYMNEAQLQDEMAVLETVLTCDQNNADLAHRIGKLAMELGDWNKASQIFEQYVRTGYQPILRDYGVAICKIRSKNPTGKEYQEGQKYLESACAPIYKDTDALASLAGTWKALDVNKTRELYRQAYEIDPTDPYAVSNYLVYEIFNQKNMTPASMMAPSIEAAIQRSKDQVEVGMNFPWAFYNLGIFHLLLNRPYDSLTAYTKAIQQSTTDWMVATSLRLLEKLSDAGLTITGMEWAKMLLKLGLAARFPKTFSLDASPNDPQINGNVMIIAGGNSQIPPNSQTLQSILEGFKDFQGTLISIGSDQGTNLASQIQAAYPDSISTLCYIPQTQTSGFVNNDHNAMRITQGDDFSPLDTLQCWHDLIVSGYKSENVKLLGIGSGEMINFEYRLALTLGTGIGVIDSGDPKAMHILSDTNWVKPEKIQKVANDAESIKTYLNNSSIHETVNPL